VEITYLPIKDIKVRIRLRQPSDEKVDEIADSISKIDLLNPITVDSNNYLLAGYHRLLAFKKLERTEIPAVIKDVDARHGELSEIDENLVRANLGNISAGVHILRREEILDELGLLYKRGDNRFTTAEDKLTINDLAEGIGYTRRSYTMRKQIAQNLHPEVQDLLDNTEWDVLTELVKLSSEPDHIQLKVCDLLITGKCTKWKSAFYEAKYSDFKLNRSDPDRIGFDIKERYGEYPQSIMKFKKVPDDLSKVIKLVNHDDHLRVQKGELNFGETEVKLHQMNPEQCRFSLDYYTREGETILDPFLGRSTTAITALHMNRKVIGFNIDHHATIKTKQVIRKNMDVPESDWKIYEECGCAMESLKDESEIIDCVFTSPPYYLKAEPYSDDHRDLCNMSVDQFNNKIDQMFGNLKRLIKTSSFEERKFYPILITVGTARDGKNGILDMNCAFQNIARDHSLTLWDQLHLQTNNPHLITSIQRNYELKMVHKNYEVQVCWMKF
jgi:DNA modification methylase